MIRRVLASVRSMSLPVSALFAAAALATVLVGCFGDLAPLSSSRDASSLNEPNWIKFEAPANVGASKTVLTSIAQIDPADGGLVPAIDLSSSLGVSFSVPAQSLSSEFDAPAKISLWVSTPGILVIDFGPDGTQFDPPATLVVKGAKTTGKSVSLYWQNPTTGAWVLQNVVVSVGSDGAILAPISHFSRYGLAD